MTIQDNLNKMENNVFYKAVATILTPAILGILGTVLIVQGKENKESLVEIKNTQKEQGIRLERQALSVNTLTGDFKELKGRVDYAVLQQLQAQDRRIERLEDAERNRRSP